MKWTPSGGGRYLYEVMESGAVRLINGVMGDDNRIQFRHGYQPKNPDFVLPENVFTLVVKVEISRDGQKKFFKIYFFKKSI